MGSPRHHALDAAAFEATWLPLPQRVSDARWRELVGACAADLDGEDLDPFSATSVPLEGGERVLDRTTIAGRIVHEAALRACSRARWTDRVGSGPLSTLVAEFDASNRHVKAAVSADGLAAWRRFLAEVVITDPSPAAPARCPFWLLPAMTYTGAYATFVPPVAAREVLAELDRTQALASILAVVRSNPMTTNAYEPVAGVVERYVAFVREAAAAGRWVVGEEGA